MEKNNVFNWKRFILVLMKDVKENGRSRLIRHLAITGTIAALFVWMGIQAYEDFYLYPRMVSYDLFWPTVEPLYFLGFLVFGCITASLLFGNMTTKAEKHQVLTLPASDLEKFLSRWLIYMVIYPLLFIVSLEIADAIRVLILNPFFGKDQLVSLFPLSILWGNRPEEMNTMVGEYQEFMILAGFYCILASAFALGSAIWHKNAAAKTLLVGLIILLCFAFMGYLLIECIFNDQRNFGEGVNINLSKGPWLYITLFIEACITLVLNILTYFRFKESEIIERW